MDDDMLFATQAFLAEFDGAASDDEGRRPVRHLQTPAQQYLDAGLATASPQTVNRQTPTTVRPTTKVKAKRSTMAAKPESPITEIVDAKPRAETLVLAVQPKSRKEELDFLRDQVSELEEKLRLLKRGVGTENRLAYPPAPQLASGPKRIASMWEDLAMRQYQQRQRAEVDNLKLKSSLEDQLKVAKSLQRMLKRSNCDALTPQNHAKRGRLQLAKSPAEDAAEFDELLSMVTEMYAQTDDAFADARFAAADVSFRDMSVHQDAATGTTIEVLNAKMVPFDVATTAQAQWDFFVNESLETQFCHVERTVDCPDDTLMKTIFFDIQMKRQSGRFYGKVVGRRYIERDRVVILWSVVAEPEEVSSTPMGGFLIRQRGWTVVRQPTTRDTEGDVATIQTKHIAVPVLYEGVVTDRTRKLELLIEYIAGAVFQQLDANQQIVENLLVQTLSRR